MKRNQSTVLVRHLSSSLRLSLAFGVVGVFSSVGSAASTSKDTYYVNDHLATTVATSDASGEIAQIESDAFGTQAGAVAKDSRFTGKPYDADMGAYVFPFRNYRSDEARWMSADPSGFPDGNNATAYAANPNSGIDPTGLITVTGLTTPSPATATGTNYSNSSTVTVSALNANAINPGFLVVLGYTFTPGSYGGTLNINTYKAYTSAGSGGADMNITVTSASPGDTAGNHWIQIVTTNDPLKGRTANAPFIDNGSSSNPDPFYDDTFDAGESYFNDNPHRALSDSSFISTVTWQADLYYVHASGTAVTVYGGIHYSWSMSE